MPAILERPEVLSAGTERSRGAAGERAGPANAEAARVVATVLLYCFSALLFIRAFYIIDPDVWWHLRAGQWILQQHTVPQTDPFSVYGADKPWTDYSWLFDAVMSQALHQLGLVAIVWYEIAIRIGLTIALFHLLRSGGADFWKAAALTAAAMIAMSRIIGPRPGMVTILALIVLFELLLRVRRSGSSRILWAVPPLFAVWANWHIQFVYGLFVVGVFAAEPLLNRMFCLRNSEASRQSTGALWVTLGASVAATLLNPYGAKVYSTVWLYAGQTRLYNQISEFLAMDFRHAQHYMVLLLALGAAVALGWKRKAQPLWFVFLLVTAVLAFRSVRETWFLAIVSTLIIAQTMSTDPGTVVAGARAFRRRAAVGLWVLAVVVAAYRHYGVSNDALAIQTAGSFPEAAVRFIEMKQLPGPLLNDLSWGGYLVWRLPQMPVALDGRTNVYGEERILRFSELWKGKPGWERDPDLTRARTVLTPRDAAIASLLRGDQRFQRVYEDPQAVIFVRR